MERPKEDYIRYRILNSHESFEDAKLLAGKNRWRSCINRLYYSCFYMINAWLYENNITAKTHNGVKTSFYKELVQTGKVSQESAQIFSRLFNWRGESDYLDFNDFGEETVKPLLSDVEKFNNEILALIENK